jgi:hypothetical protein
MEVNETGFATEAHLESAFLTAPFKGKNAFWRYFTGIIVPFLAANFIGALPLAAVILMKTLDGSPLP